MTAIPWLTMSFTPESERENDMSGQTDNAHKMSFAGNFWIDCDAQFYLGTARLQLLEKIASGHSIAEAARQLGMGYKTAWDMLNDMNRLSASPLVMSTKGGRRGGGTVITEHGKAMIAAFRAIEREHQAMLLALEQRYPEFSQWQHIPQRLQLRTSARNQLFCKIQALEKQGHRIMVTLDLGQKQYLRAMLTQNSIDEMGLSVGKQVIALLKAPMVSLSVERREDQQMLEGILQSVDVDETGSAEINILLQCGQHMIAILEDAEMAPALNSTVYAVVDPKQVILATL